MVDQPLYINDKKITDCSIGDKAVSTIHINDKLVWKKSPYNIDETVIELSTNTEAQSIELPKGKYEIIMVGPGKKAEYEIGTYFDDYVLAGASGAMIDIIFSLSKGTYNYAITSTMTQFGNISLYQSIKTSYPYTISQKIQEINGNQGDSKSGSLQTDFTGEYKGGASVYNGYGKGGDITVVSRRDVTVGEAGLGYLKIIYKGTN